MDWNWSHNGLGGGVAWDFTNKNLATAHLSPSNPKLVAKRKQKIEEIKTLKSLQSEFADNLIKFDLNYLNGNCARVVKVYH